MRIAIVGVGYVGLVTGSCLAAIGHEVTSTDCDVSKIRTLEAGNLPIYEPGLEEVVSRARAAGLLHFCERPADAIAAGDAIFICVGTPPLPSGDADLSAIDNVARLIASESRSSKLVVEKSTVPAQTGQQLKKALAVYGRKTGVDFRVASNPEFLRESTAVEDFLHPDRIVIGVEDQASERQLREIYEPLITQSFQCPVHPSGCSEVSAPQWVVTTISSAELIKHASNSFLALKISYANLVADLAERLGANAEEVLHAVGLDPRIGPGFLRPGIGFGGFCLPKDVQAFTRLAERNGIDFAMLREAERVNRDRIDAFIERMRSALWVLREKQIAVLGLAFKPNTDDIRFSPALQLISQLHAEGACVRAYDPEAMERASMVAPDVRYCADAYQAVSGADALVIATEWEDFRRLDWRRIHESMARALVLDGRNLLSPADMRVLGFEYHSIGRPATVPDAVSIAVA
ncbi:MAG: UDP-glucose dehydrogenase family protein [Candidatus Acidiferrales bacterium]